MPKTAFWCQPIDQPVERHILVRVELRVDPGYPAQQLLETGPLREVGPHHQCTDEEADQIFDFPLVPTGHRNANRDVLLPCRTGHQGGEGADQGDERRHPLRQAKAAHLLGQLRRQEDGRDPAGIALAQLARSIER